MKLFIFALLIASAVADKIIGGYETQPGDVPYIVNLKRFGGLMCGGSLLNSGYAMSAAHCNTAASSLTITAGDYNINSNDGTETAVSVTSTIPHPLYNSNTVANDIMLLKLASPISENSYIKYASLPPQSTANTFPAVGSMCSVFGWGNTQAVGGTVLPSILQGVDVPVVSNADCNAAYGGDITDGMMCLGYLGTGGKDSCQGDSGGPVECQGMVSGIVSWGIGCAYPNYPGVYTRVNRYITWINQNI